MKDKTAEGICFGNYHIKKVWRIGRLKIGFYWRTSDGLWGRFGGGWNWKLGFQAGCGTVIIALLVAELILSFERR